MLNSEHTDERRPDSMDVFDDEGYLKDDNVFDDLDYDELKTLGECIRLAEEEGYDE